MLLSDTELEERLRDGMRALGASTDDGDAVTLARLLVLLDKWNQAFNLTAVRAPRDMIGRHVLDSLTVRTYLHGMTILDVGTGAGFPGLVLAVAEPQRQFCLLDSGGKKVRFVRHAVAELGLENVEVVHSRVESYAPADSFDTVVCRAFSSLGEFVARCAVHVARGGRLVAMKGRMPQDELAGVPANWSVTRAERVAVPEVPGDRHIIVLERSD
ncbi:MAG: 16S rRNA (guanine(527)-N(7))-methyltransferase RsmG [Gammaproteobacteria bacterium]|nr:16S rRNA (guanine(527)-N(7))-methyltransferase RsmG [Gammaproteobacteria bacterium]